MVEALGPIVVELLRDSIKRLLVQIERENFTTKTFVAKKRPHKYSLLTAERLQICFCCKVLKGSAGPKSVSGGVTGREEGGGGRRRGRDRAGGDQEEGHNMVVVHNLRLSLDC